MLQSIVIMPRVNMAPSPTDCRRESDKCRNMKNGRIKTSSLRSASYHGYECGSLLATSEDMFNPQLILLRVGWSKTLQTS